MGSSLLRFSGGWFRTIHYFAYEKLGEKKAKDTIPYCNLSDRVAPAIVLIFLEKRQHGRS